MWLDARSFAALRMTGGQIPLSPPALDFCRLGITILSSVYYRSRRVKTVSFKLPDSLVVRLNSAAKKRGQAKSQLAREALERYFDADQAIVPGSCLELAADLAGSLEGPGDLSFNKKHLRGYGK